MSALTAWQSLGDRSICTFEEFKATLPGAELHDVFVSGKDVGAVIVLGPEIHACIKPEGFGLWYGKKQRRILMSVIKKYGYATTSVAVGNNTGDKFVGGLGFKKTHVEGDVWKYRKE